MKIACVHTFDTADPRVWEGRLYQMAQALKRQCNELIHLGPLHYRYKSLPSLMAKKLYYKLKSSKVYWARLGMTAAKDYAFQIEAKLRRLEPDIPDIIVSLYSPPVIACVRTAIPTVVWTDGIFPDIMELYPLYSKDHLVSETVRDVLAIEKAGLQQAALSIFCSEWAAQSAIHHYGLNPAKVRVLPVGPSFDPGLSADQVKEAIHRRPADHCRLLLIGLHWVRKGADVALEVAKRLNASGLPTELTIVGCRPPDDQSLPPWVTLAGYIDRSTPEGLEQLRQMTARSHFMIVPSRADLMGIVFCEASAFGVPSLATNVGGITGVIKNGRNGWTFTLDADPDEYCRYVIELFGNFDRYRKLAESSWNEYEARLNWPTISSQVNHYLSDVVKLTGSGSGPRPRSRT